MRRIRITKMNHKCCSYSNNLIVYVYFSEHCFYGT